MFLLTLWRLYRYPVASRSAPARTFLPIYLGYDPVRAAFERESG